MRTLAGLWPLTLVLALSACTADDAAGPAPTTTTTSADAVTTPSASPTPNPPAVDCATVTAAQQQLDDAFSDELSRLDIGRGDPRAQSVYALVTTTQGPEYYSAVLAAAPPELGADARVVLDYYQQLADRVGTIDTGDGSTEALTAAMSQLDDATVAIDASAADPTAGTAVVQAQERLQAAVGQACADSTSTSTAPSTVSGSPSDDPATAG